MINLRAKFLIPITASILLISSLYLALFFDRSNTIVRLTVAVFITFLGIVMSAILHCRTVRFIKVLSEAMAKVAKGDMTARIETVLKDEVSELAGSFNQMVEDIKNHLNRDEEYSKSSEEKVEERDRELKEGIMELTMSKTAILNVLEDVNKTKEDLKQTKEYMESLIHSLIDPMVTTDTRGIITSLSEGTEDFIGYKSEEAIGKHISLIYKDGKEEAKKIMRLMEKEGELKNYETVFVSKDGREIYCLLSASFLRDTEHKIIGTLGIAKDISKTKRLKDELKDTKDFLERIIESSTDTIVTTDIDGKITFANSGTETMFGYGKGEITGTHISQYYAGGLEEAKRVGKIIKKEGRLHYGELDFRKKDRTVITLSMSYDLLRDGEGRMIGIVAVGKDVTENKKIERELIQTKNSLEMLIEGIMDPMVTTDKKGLVTYINKGLTEILGYEKEDTLGKHISLAYFGGMEEAKKLMGLLTERGTLHNYETQFIRKDGSMFPAIVSISLIRDNTGEITGTLGICKDITERKRLEDELRETKDFLESVIEGSIDGITTVDNKGNLTFGSKGAGEMLGYTKENIQGTKISDYYVGGIDEAKKIMRLVREKGRLRNYETALVAAGGRIVPISVSVSFLKNDKGEILGTIGIYKDITENKRLEKELEKMAITDNLTGLYNQRHFYNELRREMERAKRINHPLSLLLFDVDEFKHYNDTYGHLEGDKVLSKVGRVVSENIRENVDSGYRYGGDEFMVILPEADIKQALPVAERIRVSFNNTGLVDVTLSLGLIEYRTEYDLETFISHADKAMYTAKQSGGDRINIYE